MSQLREAPQRSRQRWIYFITQAKSDLKCSNERDIATHLANPDNAASYLETIKKRPISASGCMNVEELIGWDAPAGLAPALQNPDLTFVQFAESRGEHLDHPYLPLLKARMKRGGKEVQLPLERLTMRVELGNPLKRPLPWLIDEDSQESPPANGTGTAPPSAIATTPVASSTVSTDVLAAIASLSAKLDAHLKLADSQHSNIIVKERVLADLHATRGENVYLRTEVSRQRTELENRRADLLKANRELDQLRHAAAKQNPVEGSQSSSLNEESKPESFKDLLDFIGLDDNEASTEAAKLDDLTVLEEGPKTAEEASTPLRKKRKSTAPSKQ